MNVDFQSLISSYTLLTMTPVVENLPERETPHKSLNQCSKQTEPDARSAIHSRYDSARNIPENVVRHPCKPRSNLLIHTYTQAHIYMYKIYIWYIYIKHINVHGWMCIHNCGCGLHTGSNRLVLAVKRELWLRLVVICVVSIN